MGTISHTSVDRYLGRSELSTALCQPVINTVEDDLCDCVVSKVDRAAGIVSSLRGVSVKADNHRVVTYFTPSHVPYIRIASAGVPEGN